MKGMVKLEEMKDKKVWTSLDVGSQDKYQNLTVRSLHGSQRGQQQTDWGYVNNVLILLFQ